MSFTDYREESRKNYGTNDEGTLNRDQLNTGCMLRIADAIEKIAINHQQLINERDNYKRWYEGEQYDNNILRKRIYSMKGVITKLKKQIKLNQCI